MTDAQRRVVAFVQAHPRLLAALYDLDLTPDETVFNALWPRTVRIAALYAEAAGLEPPWLATRPDRPVYGRRSPAALARQRANATREGLQMTPALDAEAEACVRALEHSPESPAARARRRARETGEAPPACAWTDEDPPCSCLDAAPLMTMRDAPGNDAAAEAFVRATTPTSADPLIRDHDADAYLGAGAVYVMPDGPVAERDRAVADRVSGRDGEHDMMGERREAGRRLLARALMFASMTDEDSPEPPERFGNGFEARAWEQTSAVPRDVRHPPRPDDHSHDAYLGTNAVFVMPELVPQVEPHVRERRMACGCVPRFELVEACAAIAAQVEREALGSPIAQDTARQIRLAILALREERR